MVNSVSYKINYAPFEIVDIKDLVSIDNVRQSSLNCVTNCEMLVFNLEHFQKCQSLSRSMKAKSLIFQKVVVLSRCW